MHGRDAESTYRALMVHVMVAMMEVDGVIDTREANRIGDIYEQVVGFRLDESIRSKLLGSVSASREDVLGLLETRRSLLDREHKCRLVRAGLRVLQADDRMHPREWRFLRDVGLALGLSDDEIDVVLAES